MIRSPLSLVVFLIAVLGLLGGCSDEPAPISAGTLEGINVRVAQPPGAESQVLSALYAEAFAASGAAVETESVATPNEGLQAVTDGDADIYLDFAGRVYTEVLDLPAKAAAPPPRIEIAKAVTDRLGERGVTALNRAPYNAVTRVVCTPEILRRTRAVNLSGLTVASEPRWTTTAAQADPKKGEAAEFEAHYPKLVIAADAVESDAGTQFAKLRDGEADCALGPAGAPQISKFALVPVADDLGKVLPNQAIALTNSDFILAAPEAFTVIANRVTAIIDDESVRELNAAVQLDDAEVVDVTREALSAAGITAGS